MKKIILFALLVFGITFSVDAQRATPRVTKKQYHQQKRIAGGLASGKLTKKEFKQLERQQRRVRKHKKYVKADGIVTGHERSSLNKHQHAASGNIYRKKHNKVNRN